MEIFLFFLSPVKPPKRDHIRDWMFGPCIEVGPIADVFLQIHCMSL